MAIKALVGRLRPDDIVLITDADEIVDRRALDGFWPHLANLRMITSKYFLNYQSHRINHANRRSGVICRGEHVARFGSTYLRTALSAQRKAWESVPSAGWHFTSVGEARAIADKFAAYAHQETSKALLSGVSQIDAQLSAVRAGTPEPGWRRVPVDERFPRFVRDNQATLAGLLLDA
jgi:beta-1,4-mannosyl-glycoprotein beta-1,4-N-acetylglucosaminyltransferase